MHDAQPDRSTHPLRTRFRRRVNRLRHKLLEPWHAWRWDHGGEKAARRLVARRAKLDGRFWFFVLGVNNSGTTLFHEMLRHHPEVRTLPREGHRLTPALPAPNELGVGRVFAQKLDAFRLTEADADETKALRVKYDWLFYCEARPGIVLEKSPPNVLRSRWLQHHFRPCRFLALFRSAYAVAEGIRRRIGVDIRVAAAHWATCNRVLLADLPRLRHVLRMKYEDLCERPDESLARLERFLGLTHPIDRGLVRQPMRAHNLDNTPRPLENFNAKSLARLSDEDVAVINEVAGPVMAELGYEVIDPRDRTALAGGGHP